MLESKGGSARNAAWHTQTWAEDTRWLHSARSRLGALARFTACHEISDLGPIPIGGLWTRPHGQAPKAREKRRNGISRKMRPKQGRDWFPYVDFA